MDRTERDPRSRRPIDARLTILLLPALVALAVRLWTGAHPVDDAYITFRYARNLATGLGLVYNPGEWVLGTTTPLWAALLAASYRAGFTDLPAAAVALAAVCDSATAALLALFGRRLGWPPLAAAAVGLAWALNPASVAYAAGGMETSLFVLVLVAGLGLAASGRTTAAALLGGVGVLVRPEALLLIGAVLGWELWRRRQWPWAAAVAAAGPVVAWGAFAARVYGDPLPHSVTAKQAAYQGSSALTNLAAFVVQAGLPGWSTSLIALLLPPATVLLMALGLTALVLLGARGVSWLRRSGLPWVPFALVAASYPLFYAVAGLRGARLWPWYLVPMIPFYVLLLAASLRAASPRRPWLLVGLLIWQLLAVDWHHPFLPAGEDLGREATYARIGEQLRAELPAGAVIAAPEIGALGYISQHPMLDTVGLISPVSTAYYPLPPAELVADNAVPPRLIQDQQPAVVVALDEFVRQSLLPDPASQRAYRLEAAYPLRIWRSEQVLVYRRVNPPPAAS